MTNRVATWVPESVNEEGDTIPAHNEYREMTQAELDERQAEQDAGAAERAAAKLNRLYQACKSYQDKSCDSNFYGMLMAVKTQSTIGTKAAQCLLWLNQLWDEYYTRKPQESPSFDFDSVGTCPHSFAEIRAEAEAN